MTRTRLPHDIVFWAWHAHRRSPLTVRVRTAHVEQQSGTFAWFEYLHCASILTIIRLNDEFVHLVKGTSTRAARPIGWKPVVRTMGVRAQHPNEQRITWRSVPKRSVASARFNEWNPDGGQLGLKVDIAGAHVQGAAGVVRLQ